VEKAERGEKAFSIHKTEIKPEGPVVGEGVGSAFFYAWMEMLIWQSKAP
jgi:hypothetical protein